MDHRSFRDMLVFSIGFAVWRSRDLLRRLVREHAPDDARRQLAERVVDHLEQSGFEVDEGGPGAQEATAEAAALDVTAAAARTTPRDPIFDEPVAGIVGVAGTAGMRWRSPYPSFAVTEGIAACQGARRC